MSSSSPASCPSCGRPATGRFCGACGAAVAGRPCGHCGGSLAPGARFCASCGAAAGGAPVHAAPATPANSQPSLLPFALAGVAVIVALIVFLIPREPAASAIAGGGGVTPASAEPPPVLDGLPPRARFDTLYNRAMFAAQRGDEMTLRQYGPAALSAYAALEEVDADAHYHAAMLRLHSGDTDGAAALADSISQREATHLFGFILRGTVARGRGDQAALRRELEDFLRHYENEMASGRLEYAHHTFILNQFLEEARGRQ